ncbi:MAG: hypothetical protein AB1540_16015 [Bdellovibrionota bacterium]
MKVLKTPLFWDLHLHGVAGVDFMRANQDAMVFACERLFQNGTGYFSPTLLTAKDSLFDQACMNWGKFLERVQKKGFLPPRTARPLGLHLEGPFLNPKVAGAHPHSNLKSPHLSDMNRWLRLAQGHIAIVTLAPELPQATSVIRSLKHRGIRVQMGHTEADSNQVFKAIKAGASGVTHLFNAMKVHHRSPGVLPALEQGLITAEIITDGVHLNADFILWCLKAAPQNLYAVSDGCSAVGAKKNQKLTLGSIVVTLKGAVAVAAQNNVLAGGATYLAEHPRRLVRSASQTLNNPDELFALFYEIQSQLFKRAAAGHHEVRNLFNPKTLSYLGTE